MQQIKIKQIGFTVVELVIVIVIASILAVVAYSVWSTSTFTLSGHANVIAADIRHTRDLSVTKNESYRINFNNSTYYQVQDETGTPIILVGNDSTDISLPSGYTISTPGTLMFDGKGVPYLNSVKLSGAQSITLSMSDGSKNITITPETGLVTVQ